MSKSVQPAVEGLEEAFREGTARLAEVSPDGSLEDTQETARRCQHCEESVYLDADHARATVLRDGATTDERACYPVFCDPTCLHEWSVEVAETSDEENPTPRPR